MKRLQDVVIVGYGRSAIGKADYGSLAAEHPSKISSEVLKGVFENLKDFPLEDIDDVIMGSALPEDVQGFNFSRVMSQHTRIPDSVPAETVSRFSASSLQSIILGANAIISGEMDVVVAGGVEFMSTVNIDTSSADPYVQEHADELLFMNKKAEEIGAASKLTRKEIDEFALRSHRKAAEARKNGSFKREIIPVSFIDKEGQIQSFTKDECINSTLNYETLSNSPPSYDQKNLCTNMNTAQTGDGVSFVVLMSAKKAKKLGMKPIAKLLGTRVEGSTASSAVKNLLVQLKMEVDDFDAVEAHEAFIPQVLELAKNCNLDENKINPRGGAVALGNPLGAAGGIMMSKILSYLTDEKKTYGLLAMDSEGGIATAIAVAML